jgi:hypothetical protein
MPLVGPVNSNLGLFRMTWTRRREDLIDGPGPGDTRPFSDPRRIRIQFVFFRGPGHARPRHFVPDVETCRVAGFFSTFLRTMHSSWHRDRNHAVQFPTVAKDAPADSVGPGRQYLGSLPKRYDRQWPAEWCGQSEFVVEFAPIALGYASIQDRPMATRSGKSCGILREKGQGI